MTRLMWVILFAVVVGFLLLFLARTYQSGSKVNVRLEQLSRLQGVLEARHPELAFRFRIATPGPANRTLVAVVEPRTPGSALPAGLADSVLFAIRRDVGLKGIDSLFVALGESIVLREPTAPGPRD